MKKYQGETIDFSVTFDGDLANYSQIIIYTYTGINRVTKFAYPAKSGYTTLAKSGQKLEGTIATTESANYCEGELCIDVMYQTTAGAIVKIAHKETDCKIIKDTIKSEVTV